MAFRCPVCGRELLRNGRQFRCDKKHSFDIASEGYVNLLADHGKTSGDSREMIAARHDFLEKGYYRCLRDAVTQAVCGFIRGGEENLIVDAGCGEGYYTQGISAAVGREDARATVVGIDISKPAVRKAAKRGCGAFFAVASAYQMPFAEASADVVTSIFAPVPGDELHRVLRPGGRLLIVAPGKHHLYGMKRILYDQPYENETNCYDLSGFRETGRSAVSSEIEVANNGDIGALFQMTPYYWKTSASGSARLLGMDRLRTQIEFELYEFLRVK